MRRAAIAGLLLLLCCAAFAGDLQVVDDFERGGNGWYPVDGRADKAQAPTCEMTTVGEARQGVAAARLRFAACPDSWAHMQLNVNPVEWSGADCDRLSLWLKGDGSGETLNVMFGNYDHKPALCYVTPIKLDFTEWKQFVLPFADFKPEGLPANLNDIVLIQLNVTRSAKPIDVLVDDILALPAGRGGERGHFRDLDVPTTPGWGLPAPKGPVAVDPLLAVPANVRLPRTLHGVRNHLDLHNPVEFAVDYAEPGAFAVRVGQTSGYGGSSLILSLDGTEALRKDFAGETQTVLTQYQGYYSVPVPAGRHVIRVNNDGADWLEVEAYRLCNYGRGSVTVARENAAITVCILGADAKPLQGLEAEVRVAGRIVPVAAQADGSVKTAALLSAFPSGNYPATAVVRQAGKIIYTGAAHILTATPLVVPERIAYPAGESVNLALRYCSAAGVAAPGKQLRARLGKVGDDDGQEVALTERAGGVYSAEVGKLAPGAYEVSVAADGRAHSFRILVHDAESVEITRTGLVKLAANGRFVTADGGDYVPWGFATIGLFRPIAEAAQGLGAWAFSSDQAVRDWIGLLKTYGVNVVRFGVNVDSMRADQGGHLSPDIAARLRHFLDLIAPLGVRALPVMWWGHYGNFSFSGVKAYDDLIKTQADWFTSAEALVLQKQYVREVAAPYATDPRIFAWEVMNETYPAGADRQAAIRWTNAIVDTMREVDPSHLTTTSACEATPAAEIEWIEGARVDFFNWHAYPTYMDYGVYRKDAGDDAIREMGNYAATMALADAGHGRPVILGETGNDRGQEADYPEFRTLITRDCLWLAFLCGSPGGISWDAIADPREFDMLSRIAAQFDWRQWQTAPEPVAVQVGDYARDLGNLARYSWWGLETGTPLSFAGPMAGAVTVASETFAPPPASPLLICSKGYQIRYLASADGKSLIAYLRNVGGILSQNVRTRTPVPLQVSLPAAAGSWQAWDLDERRLAMMASAPVAAPLDLSTTDHDFALVFRGR